MVHWGWLIAAWVIGDIMGMMVIIICIGGKRQEQKKTADAGSDPWTFKTYSNETLKEYAENANKKAADAGTSTAAHMGRKDYFL